MKALPNLPETVPNYFFFEQETKGTLVKSSRYSLLSRNLQRKFFSKGQTLLSLPRGRFYGTCITSSQTSPLKTTARRLNTAENYEIRCIV